MADIFTFCFYCIQTRATNLWICYNRIHECCIRAGNANGPYVHISLGDWNSDSGPFHNNGSMLDKTDQRLFLRNLQKIAL